MARRKQRKKRARKPRPATDPAATGTGPGTGTGKDARTDIGKGKDAKAARPGRADGPPPPVWGSFPLSQLVVLGGLILLVIGIFTSSPARVLIGLGMGSLGGLEQAAREHFSGYRSHTTLLAGIGFAVAIGITGYWLRWVIWVCLLAGIAAFAVAAWLLRRRFITASGGHTYKLR